MYIHGNNDSDSIREIRDLLDLIVQIVESVDTAIVAPNDSKSIGNFDIDGFTGSFAKAV